VHTSGVYGILATTRVTVNAAALIRVVGSNPAVSRKVFGHRVLSRFVPYRRGYGLYDQGSIPGRGMMGFFFSSPPRPDRL
jgi:hypothetical protein